MVLKHIGISCSASKACRPFGRESIGGIQGKRLRRPREGTRNRDKANTPPFEVVDPQ
jgi:hypothetical protein